MEIKQYYYTWHLPCSGNGTTMVTTNFSRSDLTNSPNMGVRESFEVLNCRVSPLAGHNECMLNNNDFCPLIMKYILLLIFNTSQRGATSIYYSIANWHSIHASNIKLPRKNLEYTWICSYLFIASKVIHTYYQRNGRSYHLSANLDTTLRRMYTTSISWNSW